MKRDRVEPWLPWLLLAGVAMIATGLYPGLTQPVRAQSKPPVHHYSSTFEGVANEPLEGTGIRSSGGCVELWLNDRVDTIFCGKVIVSEMIETPAEPTAPPITKPINRVATR